MIGPDVHAPREAEFEFALDRAHHDHGPLDPDTATGTLGIGTDDGWCRSCGAEHGPFEPCH